MLVRVMENEVHIFYIMQNSFTNGLEGCSMEDAVYMCMLLDPIT